MREGIGFRDSVCEVDGKLHVFNLPCRVVVATDKRANVLESLCLAKLTIPGAQT